MTHDEAAPAAAKTDAAGEATTLTVEFQGERWEVAPGQPFFVGRDADLTVDENPYLHRRLLGFTCEQGFWWLVNVGMRITATVSDAATGTQAWLAPGARLPLIFHDTVVAFTAGASTYRLTVHNRAPVWSTLATPAGSLGTTTVGQVTFTASQRLLIVALAEPLLRNEGAGVSQIPSSSEAAQTLGWTMTRFNRMLDAVCAKLERYGVEGLRGGVAGPATNRRARLVEYVVATNLVGPVDLLLLEKAHEASDEEDDEHDSLPPGAKQPTKARSSRARNPRDGSLASRQTPQARAARIVRLPGEEPRVRGPVRRVMQGRVPPERRGS